MSNELKTLITQAITELAQGDSNQYALSLRLESALLNEKVNYFTELLEST